MTASPKTAKAIASKWATFLGTGFHPDTPGADYDPPLTAAEARDYDKDMERLFLLTKDPYAVAMEAVREKIG